MNYITNFQFIFIKDPGVYGFISRKYPNKVIQAKYYLDGILYTIELDCDEWSEFNIKGEYNE
jgi:hypothetical protein